MPTYEYECKKCGAHFEVTCHWEEREQKAECPECHSKEVEPVISGFSCEPPKKW